MSVTHLPRIERVARRDRESARFWSARPAPMRGGTARLPPRIGDKVEQTALALFTVVGMRPI
jgi:hypothetical protein